MISQLFRRKSIQDSLQSAATAEHSLKRVLTVRDLTLFGIAAIVGAGIFSTIGQAAFRGGPSVMFLFVLTAISCGLAALCYAEFSARVPVSGSAYTYAYVTFGELAAWMMACCLVLEYLVSNMVVAVSWGAYFGNLLEGVGIHIPQWLQCGPFDNHVQQIKAEAPHFFGIPIMMNLPTAFIIIPVTWICYVGMNETKKSSNLMVYLKLVIMLVVIVVGAFYVDINNLIPLFPNGVKGMFAGVSAVFFAYIGFDAISTTAEECKDPQHDIPKSIVYSLIICTVIYVLIALILTGAVNYSKLEGVADPIAYLFEQVGNHYMLYIISVGSIIATTTALILYQLGQPRIWMMMSRDGLLPKHFARISRRNQTPSFGTILAGVLVGVGALFFPLEMITDVTSIGALFAFAFVCFGILFLPKLNSHEKKTRKMFRVPYINGRYIMPLLLVVYLSFNYQEVVGVLTEQKIELEKGLKIIFLLCFFATSLWAIIKKVSLIPIIGGMSCLYLLVEIPAHSWMIFGYWMGAGLIIYFFYGYRKSKLRTKKNIEPT